MGNLFSCLSSAPGDAAHLDSEPEVEGELVEVSDSKEAASRRRRHRTTPGTAAVAAGGPGSKDVREVLFFPDPASLKRLLWWLGQAKKSLDIAVFTITHNQIRDAILAAHARGAKVRIVTDDEKEHSKGSDIAFLKERGIPVRTDSSPAHMHHKFCVVDNAVLLNGSFNWTVSAAEGNNENIVVTNQQPFVRDFAAQFDKLWAQFA